MSQGQNAAKALLGRRTHFEYVPYCFSDVYDLPYELWADPLEADRVVYCGDLQTRDYARELFRSKRDVVPERLYDATHLHEAAASELIAALPSGSVCTAPFTELHSTIELPVRITKCTCFRL